MARRSRDEFPHPPLHAILLIATLITVYPILWVVTIALSGKQSLAIAVTALFSFMTGWNEFILGATLMDKETMYTAPVGLRFFVGGFQQQWGYFAAGAIIVSIPIVALFFFLQRYLVSGLTAGSVKG